MLYKIGCAVPETAKGKATTFNYKVLETDNEAKFIKAINTFATIPVDVKGGHRSMDNVTEIFGWLRFDLDAEGEAELLEPLLKPYEYVKKPSTRNDEFPYKWHYLLPVTNQAQDYEQFKDQARHFCEINDIELKDMAVTISVTQNMNPYKGDIKKAIALTTVNEGVILALPAPRIEAMEAEAPSSIMEQMKHSNDISYDDMVEMMSHIDVMDYNVDWKGWWGIGKALHSWAVGNPDITFTMAEGIYLNWSGGNPNYDAEASVDERWTEIRRDKTVTKPTTFATIIKKAKGGGYVKPNPEAEKAMANFEELCNRINIAETVDDIKALAKDAAHLGYSFQTQLPSLMKERATVVDKEHKHSVAYFKTLFDLAGVKKREERQAKKEDAKAKKEDVKGMQEHLSAYYDSALGEYYVIDKRDNKIHRSKQQGLVSVGNGLGYVGEVIRDFVITNNKLISKYTQETDYLTQEEISFTERASNDPSAPLVLANLINPLINIPTTFNGDMGVVEDFFKVMWNGKAEDVIRLIGLTMRFKETKLNKIHLVAPSNFGKTNLLEQIGFQTIVMKRLLPALNAEKGIGKSVIDGLKASGLLLIDEANQPLDQSIKDIDNYMQLDQFGQGGTQEIKLHYTVMTSTHKTAVRGMSDEMYNRMLLIELTSSEAGHPIDKSHLFIQNPDHYTKNVKEYSMWLLKDALFNTEYTKKDLKALQDKYRLELNSDTDEMLVEVSERVVAEFKSLASTDGDIIVRNGVYLIKRKKDLVSAIEDRFGEYSHIDKGKYTDTLTNHFLGERKSVKVNGRPVKYYMLNLKTYYASTEDEQTATVLSMLTNLDTGKAVEEIDDFLS